MGPSEAPLPAPARIVVATTVALSFISFWRGAAIVLSDLASTMFYVGGITEHAIGKSAPWFVLGVMLFGFAIRSIYLESCGMYVRGGVYVVVRDSMGPAMAKLSVSALVVDYVLTGPISSVAAGQYLARLANEFLARFHPGWAVEPFLFSVLFGAAVTAYFWRQNVRGIRESSGKALRIMQITTVMVVCLLVWCPVTLILQPGVSLPPGPSLETLRFDAHSLGWLEGTVWPGIWLAAMVIAFGHSLLAMSGFETLAQVYREIAYPKMRNLKITAGIVCAYGLLSTGLISLFAVMIIPDGIRPHYYDNLIGGLAMHLAGPELLKLAFHVFVVLVGTLILSGAVNTSLLGANGVLNRVAEDQVLTDWFRRPHPRFGTTYRLLNGVAGLQVLTILFSRGDVYLLGEAYAFGVVWSFFLKGLGVLVLRFQRRDQEYKVPLNLRVAGRELPLGLLATTSALFLVAIANLFTKKAATAYGLSFTALLFILFTASEWRNRRRKTEDRNLEHFRLDYEDSLEGAPLAARPGAVLVAVRDFTRMDHLQRTLVKTNPRRHDIVVVTVRVVTDAGAGEYELLKEQLFTPYERELFSRVVSVAEKAGKRVELLVATGVEPFSALVDSAHRLRCSRLVMGVSPTMSVEELARRVGLAWERLPGLRHPFSLEIVRPGQPPAYFDLGPHPPRLWPEDVERLHDLWLRLSAHPRLGSRLHHRDVVSLALKRLQREIEADGGEKITTQLERELRPE